MNSFSGKFWAGKLVGALIGFVSGGPFGLLVGAFAGHLLDQALARFISGQDAVAAGSAGRAQVQQVFFRATFRVMGRLAKADGRVSEQEIDDGIRRIAQQNNMNMQQFARAVAADVGRGRAHERAGVPPHRREHREQAEEHSHGRADHDVVGGVRGRAVELAPAPISGED